MSLLNRRRFMGRAALCAMGVTQLPSSFLGIQTRPASIASKAKRSMKITDIEIYEILPPFHDYNAAALSRYIGLAVQLRTTYIVKTDIGLEGYGENEGPARKKEQFAKYIGTDPFDWLADNENLPMNMAVYDLMGKYLGLPAWKLLGPKVRSWVPIGAWTVPRPPEAMAEEVLQLSRRGFRWLKYHVDVLQNAIDQTEAMQKVAPAGFKIHYDFNADSNFEAVYPVLKELEKFPVAGRVEDPIRSIDHAGYRILREKCRLSILGHHTPHDFFMLHGLYDGAMVGHAPIGSALKLAALAEVTNTPLMLQNTGGTINQAFLAHEAAVFKMALLDHINDCNIWKDDVTVETMPVIGGSVQVPDKPGLGVTVDRAKLEKYSRAPRPKQTRFLVHVQYKNGPQIYYRYNPDESIPQGKKINQVFGTFPFPGYGNPVRTDFWDAEGTQEFEQMWKRTESGPVWIEAKKK